jgi:ribosomal protein L35
LDTSKVLTKRTRSGKAVASSETAPEQPHVPKKKRKDAIRKLKESTYVAEEEENIEVATGLVTREVKKKKAEDAATLAKIRELAKCIKVTASSLAREDAGVVAQQAVQASEKVQELATS